MSLNEAQAKAVAHRDGPMLVLAGPGSGKTLVITRRTKHLIEHHGISPSEILVITFTKAAATEMKERFHKLMGNVHASVTFGTFHAVFFAILKQAYHFTAANILREDQRIQYLKDIISKMDMELDDESEFISGITSEISMVKNDRISLDYYYSCNCSEENFRKIYEQYEQKLRKANLIDFDDMLVFCYELFKERPDILQGWQKRFRYILIDEFQDINQVQFDVIKMLALPENNLFIVGDDDQSIYRFRGAKPEIMLNFKVDYPEAAMVLLDTNYRSKPLIVNRAIKVISNNKNRYNKAIKSYQEEEETTSDLPPSDCIEYQIFDNQSEENAYIINHIQQSIKDGEQYSDFAILFRTNIGPRLLVERFMEHNIPFIMKDTIPNIYEHWIAKNILTYIYIALGSRERRDFLQIMNRPKRYISRECMDNIEVSFDSLRQFYQEKEWMLERIDKLEYDIKMLSQMVPYSAIHFIRHGIGYEEYLKEYAKYRRIKPEDLIDVLQELQESAKPYKTFDEWFKHIEHYSIELQEQSKNKERDSNSVTFATMHSSKGLEFKNVYLIDINEGISPHQKAVIDADIQEERRMFYVGMTRAKEQLHIFSIKEHYNKQLPISRFVGESLLSLTDLQPGVQVQHIKYKLGTIKAIEDGKLIIQFQKPNKLLTLDASYCITNQIIKLL